MWIFGLITLATLGLLKLFNKNISMPELAIQVGCSVLVTFAFWMFTFVNFEAIDYEVWNGEISKKEHVVKNCPNGWVRSTDSFCSEYIDKRVYDGESCATDKDGNKTCISLYHTEYNYDYPWEGRWYIESENLGKVWQIGRVDRQGAEMPPFYANTNVGDPASSTSMYKNWVLAAKDSVFHEDGEKEDKYRDVIPDYPMDIYDIFKIDRVRTVGVEVDNIAHYNQKLSVALKDLGPQRQMNAIILVVNAKVLPIDFAYAVRRAWSGFKKNDAVIFIGVADNKVAWTEVLSWSKNSIFNIEMRDSIVKGQPLNLDKVIDDLHDIGMRNYVRRSMKEFEFLKDQIPTPIYLVIAFVLLQLLMAVASTIYFNRKDVKL